MPIQGDALVAEASRRYLSGDRVVEIAKDLSLLRGYVYTQLRKNPTVRSILVSERAKRISSTKVGHKVSPEARVKIAEKLQEYFKAHPQRISQEQREKIRKTLMGHEVSDVVRAKISRTLEGVMAGPKHPAWLGGISKLPYPWDFNGPLCRKVKARDGHTCALCGTQKDLAVHHIDYVKDNLALSNLITLCRSCNSRVNFGRDKWKVLFQTIIREKYPEYRDSCNQRLGG